MDLPKNMEMDKLTGVVDILSNKLIGATLPEIRAINSNFTDKVLDAALFIGLIREQNNKYMLSENGKKYYQSPDTRGKNEALRELLKNIDIYNLALEHFFHSKAERLNKLDVGTFWAKNFQSQIKTFSEEDITSTIIFFFKFLELASLGKFINAGRGRETRIDLDLVELAKYITSSAPQPETRTIPQPDVKTHPQPEKKPSSPETREPQLEDESSQGNSGILKRLNPELVWSDLDSEGAKKLLIDKLNILSNENIVLNAKVDEYQKIALKNAVLNEKVNNLRESNLFRASVNSIGGIVLGASLTMNDFVFKAIGSILGGVLIATSLFLKQSEPKKSEDE
jgi:hypothetical protein